MNKKNIFIGICLLVFALGCKNENQKFKEKASTVITSYIEKNMDEFKVDSISILGIDSLTHLDYAYFRKVILKNHESGIFTNELLYIEPQTDQEYEMQEELQSSLRNIQTQITECDNILINPTTDTVTIQYYLIATSIYGKQGGKPQQHDIGFPIDKNFNIQEIDLGNK